MEKRDARFLVQWKGDLFPLVKEKAVSFPKSLCFESGREQEAALDAELQEMGKR